MNTIKDILLETVGLQGLTPVPIPEVPALDGKIFVRVMTAGERQLWMESVLHARDAGTVVADYEVVAICACEADGTPMFHQRTPEGRLKIDSAAIRRLLDVDGRVISAIARKAIEVSGLDLEASDRAKKDSESSPSDDSSSDSQASLGGPSKNSLPRSTQTNSSNGMNSSGKSRGAMT